MGCAGVPSCRGGEISGNLNISGAIPPPACSSGRGRMGGAGYQALPVCAAGLPIAGQSPFSGAVPGAVGAPGECLPV